MSKQMMGLVKRTIGYRCQFKCLNMKEVVDAVSKHDVYGSVYVTHFYCSYCEKYFPYSLYGDYIRCPCCNRSVRRKSNKWKKAYFKPVIKYIE